MRCINFDEPSLDEIYSSIIKFKYCLENSKSKCSHDCPWCEEFDPVMSEKRIKELYEQA